jgi:hypothetical protein
MTFSRQQPSSRYRELLEQYRAMHRDGDPKKGIAAEQMFDGRSLPRQASRIKALVTKTGAQTLLDYGCGKGGAYQAPRFVDGLQTWNGIREYWGVEQVKCYDPAYLPYAELPAGSFDGVLCTDVLEHCPAEDLPWIVGELFGFAQKFVFANVACYPAGKSLPNGENAHCTLRPTAFWQEVFGAAATARPGILWELWVDVTRGQDTRVANFPSPNVAPRVPLWRFV